MVWSCQNGVRMGWPGKGNSDKGLDLVWQNCHTVKYNGLYRPKYETIKQPRELRFSRLLGFSS